MGSTVEFRRAFVARLKQACDESSIIPEPGKGRQQMIADRLGVGAEAVSKWFKGVAMPKADKLKDLADLLETDQSWLAFGIEPELDRSERRIHAKESDGAIHLVWGLIMLAGGHCGEPSSRDPRAEYIDFYATLRGSVYPICVSLARPSQKDMFEVTIPEKYQSVRTIVVVPAGMGKYEYLDLPIELINEYKSRKSGGLSLVFTQQDKKFYAASTPIPRIRNFAELK